ncbi:MAG: HU family DNA-binding protein [Phycisphaerae bacterium]
MAKTTTTTKAPAKPMTKSQIAAEMAERLELPKKKINEFFEQLSDLAYKEAKKRPFTLPGIGKLVLQHRKARMGRNPQTGEPVKIPAKKVVKFRIAKQAKDNILPAGK